MHPLVPLGVKSKFWTSIICSAFTQGIYKGWPDLSFTTVCDAMGPTAIWQTCIEGEFQRYNNLPFISDGRLAAIADSPLNFLDSKNVNSDRYAI